MSINLKKLASKSSAILIAIALFFAGVAVGMVAFRKIDTEKPVYESFSERSSLIDLNEATEEDLQKIEGVGEVTAKAIVEYREENGRFTCVEDLLNVYGIGEKRLKDIALYVTVK